MRPTGYSLNFIIDQVSPGICPRSRSRPMWRRDAGDVASRSTRSSLRPYPAGLRRKADEVERGEEVIVPGSVLTFWV